MATKYENRKLRKLADTAVIIVVYKYPKNLLNNLLKQVRQVGVPSENIYIRDNTFDDVGYGAGINSIVRNEFSKFKFFLVMNPDIEVNPASIESLRDTLIKNRKIGIVGPKILNSSGKIWALGGKINKKRYSSELINFGDKNYYEEKLKKVDFVPGTIMLIRKSVFERIGLFHEDYFLYYDEVDFCIRANMFGFGCYINPKSVVTHYASATVGKNSPAMIYYMARNRLYVLERFAPLGIKIREAIRFPITIFQARHSKFELLGIRDFLLRKVGRNDNMLSKIDL